MGDEIFDKCCAKDGVAVAGAALSLAVGAVSLMGSGGGNDRRQGRPSLRGWAQKNSAKAARWLRRLPDNWRSPWLLAGTLLLLLLLLVAVVATVLVVTSVHRKHDKVKDFALLKLNLRVGRLEQQIEFKDKVIRQLQAARLAYHEKEEEKYFDANAITFAGLQVEQGTLKNPLWEWFITWRQGEGLEKWVHYFDVYHRYLSKFRKQQVHLLQVGLQSGGPLAMWRSYYGAGRAHIYGVDSNPYLRPLFHKPGENCQVFTGDAGNRTFWRELVQQTPKLDVVVDSGGASMPNALATFEELYPMLSDGGIYIVEDTAASYDSLMPIPPNTNPRHIVHGSTTTWMEHCKALVDQVNGYYIAEQGMPSDITKQTVTVAFHDQMVVFEKGLHPPPRRQAMGNFKLNEHGLGSQVSESVAADYQKHLQDAREGN